MKVLEDYRGIVSDDVIADLHRRASRLLGHRVVHMNSTAYGGGVAEILYSLVPLMNDAGLQAGWRVLVGDTDFFNVTKSFHNGIQGASTELTEEMKQVYLQTNEAFSQYTHIRGHDAIIIHDPQPLPIIRYYNKWQPWIWRCHIDLSNPDPGLWDFLKGFILRYDMVIISHESYRRADLPIEQRIVHPAIDPLGHKNCELSEGQIADTLKRFDIPTDKPIITQVSRFDRWKDPVGVVEVFKRVRERVDCRLVLAGNMATDDPEGADILAGTRRACGDLIESGDVIFVLGAKDTEINALQKHSSVVLQKSLREGFGLTVSEAIWKGTPVVAGNVGGIPLQLKDGVGGFVVDPTDYDTCAERVVYLLENPAEAEEMGRLGKEHVRENFLTTRLLGHWLAILEEVIPPPRGR
ncbi:MAG: glycosyltransferase [Coriobacteriia bacterium]